MEILRSILTFLDADMPTPTAYGWFHLLWLALIVIGVVYVCTKRRNDSPETIRKVVLLTAVVVIILEVYKQIVFTFSCTEAGIAAAYQWYIFPWQFCSTPMYVGLLAGLTRKGKIHNSLCAYLTTFAVFAGTAVMLYPNDIYIGTIGINIQTSVCHGSMIVIGAYLLATGYVKLEHKTILKAIPTFAVTIGVAMILNEVAQITGLNEEHTFNMFYISPYHPGTLPVYSLIQQVVPYPLNLIIYIVGFGFLGWLMLLIAMGIRALARKLRPAKAAV